jgi:hypothetical protein
MDPIVVDNLLPPDMSNWHVIADRGRETAAAISIPSSSFRE